MAWSRRLLLGVAASLPTLAAAAPARAATAHYPMACDPALVPALRQAAEVFLGKTDIFVHMLPTSPALLVPQLTHQIQNDIVMARDDIAAGVAAAGYPTPPGAPSPRFRNRLVLATRVDAPASAIKSGPFAITDKTPDQDRDDGAILVAMGLNVAHPVGAIDTGGVAFLVSTGAAGAGLMLMSDVRQDPSLKVAMEVPDSAAPPVIYIASTTRTPRRPDPEAFVAFLAAPEGAAILARHGLELMS